MTLGRGETAAMIAQLRVEREGEGSFDLRPTTHLVDEDGSSEVGSGDGNLSSTPDSTGSGDMSLAASAALAEDTDDGRRQVGVSSSSITAVPERPSARRSRSRGLRGLNGGVSPRRTGPAEAATVDESVGVCTERQNVEDSYQRQGQTHIEQICVSFVAHGPIGLELTVSAHDRQQTSVVPAVVVRAIRPGTQANAHVPPLCPGLILMSVGDADVSGSDHTSHQAHALSNVRITHPHSSLRHVYVCV
jgi:hypothetical protein